MAVAAEIGASSEFDYQTRRYHDTTTWLAEVLPGQMRTPFEYTFDGQELYASDGSKMGEIFKDSVESAQNLPSYELRRRKAEMAEYGDMVSIMKDELPNTMVVVSDFPPELMTANEDVGGYNTERKQTMLRVISKTPEGNLQMYSQSLDHSNRTALEQIYKHLGQTPAAGELLGQRIHLNLDEPEQHFLIDELTGVYDKSMSLQYGGNWYAGQVNGRKINTYDFVCEQADLINSYLNSTDWFTGGEADYDLAAAMLARYQSELQGTGVRIPRATEIAVGPSVSMHTMSMLEMRDAGSTARASGMTFSGCGATVGGGLARTMSAYDQMEEAGYGNKLEEYVGSDKYGSLQFKCKRGHKNIRPRNKLLERCKVCKCSVRC